MEATQPVLRASHTHPAQYSDTLSAGPPRCVLLTLILDSSVPNVHGAVHLTRPLQSDQSGVFYCSSQRGSLPESDKCRLNPSVPICALRPAEEFFHLCQLLQEERKDRIRKALFPSTAEVLARKLCAIVRVAQSRQTEPKNLIIS